MAETKQKQQHQQSEHQDLWDMIETLQIKKQYLAELVGMNPYTFRMKLDGNRANYKFTEAEIEQIRTALCELGGKLQSECKTKKK
jgi:hypothetical protein